MTENEEPKKAPRWASEWWWDVQALLDRAHALYTKAVKAGKPTMPDKAAEVLLELRKWKSVAHRIKSTLPEALKDLQVFYAPEGWGPGPMEVFPEFDVDGKARQAQSKPMSDRFGSGKYFRIGDKDAFMGPIWVGNDPDTVEEIVATASVLLVEGPFDLVAVRATEPRIPSMTSLTKKLGWKHIAYLSMLGVSKVYLLFDSELSEVGDVAMSLTMKKLNQVGIEVEILECPAKDPSKALESIQKFDRLKTLLNGVASRTRPTLVNMVDEVIEEEDWLG